MSIRDIRWTLLLSAVLCIAAGPALSAAASAAPASAAPAAPSTDALSAREIIARAQAAAGGETWIHPRTLLMRGHAVFYTPQGPERHERYEMWRVYPAAKGAAHAADGKVRIESWHQGRRVRLVTFDGERSYTLDGPQPPSEADKQWSENFGFGVIRFALEPGFRQERLPDEVVEGRPVRVVRITDPSGQATTFSMAKDDDAILRLGFDTPRGWHERLYSQFFRKPGVSWVQPGRVRLYYDGVIQNEIFWTDFELDRPMPDALFVVPAPGTAATAPTGSPALYVVRDADSTMYLFGTLHLRRADETWSSPVIEAALAASDEVWTEIDVSPAAMGDAVGMMMRRGMAPPDAPLSSRLSPEAWTRLKAALAPTGLSVERVEPMQPWFAALMLSMAPALRAGYTAAAGADLGVGASGASQGKRMRAFETMEQQIGFLADLPEAVQLQMLSEAMDEETRNVDQIDPLGAAWERGDLEVLDAMNEAMRHDYPELFEALIVRRNAAWVATLLQELEGAGSDFVAVGAAHLVGPEGLVAQLRARGVQVERVTDGAAAGREAAAGAVVK